VIYHGHVHHGHVYVASNTVVSGGTALASAATQISTDKATIVVSVPSDATVTIDGQATSSTSTVRTFQSPKLDDGKTYAYTIEASFVQDGKQMKSSKQVSFQAGKTVNLDLTSGAVAVASK